jgi:hypothetical protein
MVGTAEVGIEEPVPVEGCWEACGGVAEFDDWPDDPEPQEVRTGTDRSAMAIARARQMRRRRNMS